MLRFISLDEKMNRILEARIAKYENRYEMKSCEMAKALSHGDERETAEKLRWMFDYHVLEYLKERTPTTGTHGSPMSSSMRSASQSISS